MDAQWPYAIRRQRLIRKLTQRQLANMAGVSRKTIAALESVHQQEPVSWTVLTRVASILGLAITLTPEPPPPLDAGNDAARMAHRKRVRTRLRPVLTGPPKPVSDLKDMTLQQAFSRHTAICLIGHFGNISLPELLACDRSFLRRTPNIGKKRLNEIEQFFEGYGLCLGDTSGL